MTKLQRPTQYTRRETLSAELLHDLRTPLNQMIGYSEILTEKAEEEGLGGFVPDLRRIQKAGRQMLGLLVDEASPQPVRARPSDEPVAEAAPETPVSGSGERAAPEQSTSASRELILVVDDDEMNRDVLTRRLERQGYRVATAGNGRQAMDAVHAQPFDLVLLDIMMPEMDGYEVLRRLKANQALRHVPVIMISALDELESVVRCINMGAEDYLPRPVDPTLLKARIGSCLETKRAHDSELRLLGECRQNFKRLQCLEKLRDDLTHAIIHDLRTPLSAMISGLQALAMADDLVKSQYDLLNAALRDGQSLFGMVNSLLDICEQVGRIVAA